MSYTTIANVEGMLPSFAANEPGSLSDTQVQLLIDGIAGEMDGILQRRFGEVIKAAPYNGVYSAWVAALPATAVSLLERINRHGALGEMEQALTVSQSPGFAVIAKASDDTYKAMLRELAAELPSGRPKPAGGRYDKLFDPLSATPTPRPQLGGFPGAGISPDGENADFAFHKWNTPESDIDSGTNEDPFEGFGESGE